MYALLPKSSKHRAAPVQRASTNDVFNDAFQKMENGTDGGSGHVSGYTRADGTEVGDYTRGGKSARRLSLKVSSEAYRNSAEFHDDLAAEWLSAGGLNNDDDMRQTLLDFSDEELAAMVVEPGAWSDLLNDEVFSIDDLAAAFARWRLSIREEFGS